jgi:hypothetical protein
MSGTSAGRRTSAELADLLRTVLEPDGFRAAVQGWPNDTEPRIRIELLPIGDACGDCLVPKQMLAAVLARKLELPPDVEIELVYPSDR